MNTNIVAELCLYILTWNVGTHQPKDLSLSNLLSLNGTSACPDGKLPDVYAIAFQEVSTNAKNQFHNLFRDDPWTFKIAESLNDFEYVKIDTEQMQGILLMIFAQKKHIPHMKDIETEETATGLGGVWGNKGAVSIRMSLYGTGVTFVAAHLAAHEEKLKERIEDYNKILSNHHYKLSNYKNIFDHEFVFWFGDLNFRLNTKELSWDIRTAVEQDNWNELLVDDQLTFVRNNGIAFQPLNEETPNFPPTFKFFEGTSDYNIKRRPAWCDRILYRVDENRYPNITLSVKQLSYTSHPEYILSDHKPVSGVFLYKIESETVTDDELYEMTHGGSETFLASVTILFISLIVHTF